MKRSLCLALLFVLSINSFGRKKENKFVKIDEFARNTGYYPLKELANKLTAPYKDEESKVRSIFVWVTAHIDYDVEQYKSTVSRDRTVLKRQVDSLHVTKDLYWNYVLGLEALQYKKAVCAGYAALFKVLCEEACLRAVVINGAARKPFDIGRTTKSNHAWNAVMIGEEWKLLDLTWASGQVTHTDQFVREFNEHYYCISPEHMILDHYPDVFAWALLPKPVSKIWYDRNAYIFSGSTPQYIPTRYLPAQGMFTARRNDTLSFELDLNAEVYNIAVQNEQTKTSDWYYPDPANKDRSGKAYESISSTKTVKGTRSKAKSMPGKISKSAPKPKVVNTTKEKIRQAIDEAIAGEVWESDIYSSSEGFKRFQDDGKTVKFRYIVKRGGMNNLVIFINREYILQYSVFVR